MNYARTIACVLSLAFLLNHLSAFPVAANDPVLLNNYALELLKNQEYEKALEQLQKAFSLNPYNPALRRNLAEAYAHVGRREMERNAYEDAAANFDHARELFPDESKYALMRGIALYSAKNYDAAAIELERARSTGETVEILYFLGRVHYDTGNLSAALETWEKAAAIDPSNKIIKEQLEKARRESTVEGKMDRGYSSRFTISHDTETKSDLADTILSTLEDAYNQVGSDLSHFPTAKVPVILYTRKDYRSVTESPEWSGGLYDGKIRLPVGGAKELTPLLRGVLFHEYTHVVVNELTAGHCPTWLNEGLAEIAERKAYEVPSPELAKAARQGSLLDIRQIEGSFSALSAKQAALAYQQSYSLVNFMVTSYGWYKVKDVLVNLGKGMTITSAMAKAFDDFGLDYSKVVAEWQNYLKREYAP